MLKRIIAPSAVLINFILILCLNLSKPQEWHLKRVVEALIVGEGSKTLSGLYRQWVDAPDVSAVADFFRVSPWAEEAVQQAQQRFVMSDLLKRAKASGAKAIVWVSIDDSMTVKDKDTVALESVDWMHDHSARGGKGGGYRNGSVHVSCRVQIGSFSYPFSFRLYLREKTVRRLNRLRSPEMRLKFKSKYHLAKEMLRELKPYIPAEYKVYVLFDRWYASAKLIKFIRKQGKRWHVLCAIKSNRCLDGIALHQLNQQLKHTHTTSVEVRATDGSVKTYQVRRVQGHLNDVPFEVCVLISRRHYRDTCPKYFLCTDLSLSAQTILNWYSKRWSMEVEYWYLKQKLGLGDFRLHDYEAIDKWYGIVYFTLTFLYWRWYQSQSEEHPLHSIAEVIEQHRADHARALLTAACQQAIETGNVDAILERFLTLPQVP
jgi:hypothetical protein